MHKLYKKMRIKTSLSAWESSFKEKTSRNREVLLFKHRLNLNQEDLEFIVPTLLLIIMQKPIGNLLKTFETGLWLSTSG